MRRNYYYYKSFSCFVNICEILNELNNCNEIDFNQLNIVPQNTFQYCLKFNSKQKKLYTNDQDIICTYLFEL